MWRFDWLEGGDERVYNSVFGMKFCSGVTFAVYVFLCPCRVVSWV